MEANEGEVVEEGPPPLRNRVSIPEAWIHLPRTPELECTPEQIAFMDEIFFKSFIRSEADEPDEDDDPLPGLQGAARDTLGWGKFRRYMSQVLREANPLQIREGHMLWYYNRNTIAQIYFRVRSEPTVGSDDVASMPLYRSFDPWAEFQLDTFQYRVAGNPMYPDQPARFVHVLVGIDPSTRIAFARALQSKSAASIATAMVAMIPEDIQPQIRMFRTDAGTEFVQLLSELGKKGWSFPKEVKPDSEEAEPRMVQDTEERKIAEFRGVRHQMENKAGTMLTGQNSSPALLAPVETMVRTVREIIEEWKRAGDRNGQGWQQNLERLMIIYNHTIHSAFDNKYTPMDVLQNEGLQQQYKAKNDERRSAYRRDVREEGLRAGDFVRIKRVSGDFAKQSVPTWSYDVYEVMDTYGKNGDYAHVPLRRVRQVTRERAGAYSDPAPHNVDQPPPVHFSRLAHVKTLEIDGRPGQTIDPPADTRWLGFFASLDTRTYTQRQQKEGDFVIRHRGPMADPEKLEPARQLTRQTVGAMVRGKREARERRRRVLEAPEVNMEEYQRAFPNIKRRRRRQANRQ